MSRERILDGPALVVIDNAAKTYARYWGLLHTMMVQGAENLSATKVELYRLDPHKFMGMETA